ncbi:Protein DENND6B-like [Oopsacas minuta]|uniref:Protein DENND6B-like n=1 Tax=Oopsacas minuta TaxID=111878 RepID=A0AAV7KI36_9METZ|nr:Protein DENND6B-like [Oopsacas minuta]
MASSRSSNWLCCFCVVTFDLEIGQALESVYPSEFPLSEDEKTNICYLAFPDSNAGLIGDVQFHFRIPASGIRREGCNPKPIPYSSSLPLVLRQENNHYFGFVYFRQTKDASIRRGYFQKSVILITRLPFFNLFSTLMGKVAPEVFKVGNNFLEVIYQEICHWQDMRPSTWLQLPVMGQVLAIKLPTKMQKKDTAPTFQFPTGITALASVNELNLTYILHSVLPQAGLLWELVLTNEPIFVVGTSPKLCSDFVQALVSLIHPLRYAEDYRPYFTVHDTTFSEYSKKTHVPPGVILGVTNPYFAKVLEHWPSQIRIGDPKFIEGKVNSTMANNSNGQESKSGIFTKYKCFTQKDKSFIKLIDKPPTSHGKRPIEAQNLIIKKYFEDLTSNFLIPLERYLVSLIPISRDINPWLTTPILKQFITEDFIKTLAANGPQQIVGIKGNWEGLYRSFILSPNFRIWFEERRREVNLNLHRIYLDKLSKVDVNFWLREKTEVEIVDFYLRVKSVSDEAINLFPTGHPVLLGIQKHLSLLRAKIPIHLQNLFTVN